VPFTQKLLPQQVIDIFSRFPPTQGANEYKYPLDRSDVSIVRPHPLPTATAPPVVAVVVRAGRRRATAACILRNPPSTSPPPRTAVLGKRWPSTSPSLSSSHSQWSRSSMVRFRDLNFPDPLPLSLPLYARAKTEKTWSFFLRDLLCALRFIYQGAPQ